MTVITTPDMGTLIWKPKSRLSRVWSDIKWFLRNGFWLDSRFDYAANNGLFVNVVKVVYRSPADLTTGVSCNGESYNEWVTIQIKARCPNAEIIVLDEHPDSDEKMIEVFVSRRSRTEDEWSDCQSFIYDLSQLWWSDIAWTPEMDARYQKENEELDELLTLLEKK